jgi:hypothetical protein
MPKHSDLEQKALQFIIRTGDDGVLQSSLWRDLDASSREGSRIVLKLERKGLIRREKELSEGRWTYRIYPLRKPATINSIIDCPCLTCETSVRCGAYGAISPINCEALTEWISSLAQRDAEFQGDS